MYSVLQLLVIFIMIAGAGATLASLVLMGILKFNAQLWRNVDERKTAARYALGTEEEKTAVNNRITEEWRNDSRLLESHKRFLKGTVSACRWIFLLVMAVAWLIFSLHDISEFASLIRGCAIVWMVLGVCDIIVAIYTRFTKSPVALSEYLRNDGIANIIYGIFLILFAFIFFAA
jgi:hypothetical protein